MASAIATATLAATAAAGNWPQWRGPNGLGVSSETRVPTEWGETKNVKWKTAIEGGGHSSPIVWGKRVFLTVAIEGDVIPDAKAVTHTINGQEFKHPDWTGSDKHHTLKVLCLDADSGKILWSKTSYEGTVFDHRHRRGSYAAPTPITDGKHVYAFFGSEGLYCYDFSGKLVWKVSFGGLATLGMGVGTSPVIYKDLLIVQCDQDTGENSFLVALNRSTGKEVWRATRKVQVSWSTPLIVDTGRRTELITNGNELIIAYDPATGKELWRTKGVESNAIPTPVAGHGMVFVSAGYPQKRTIAIKLGGSGDITATPNVAWRYDKGTAYVPSTLLYGDFVYLLSDNGILTCLDAKTGDLKYEGGRVPVPARFMASPVAFDGKILITSEDGDTFIVKAGPQHEILRTNSLGEPIFSSPAIADGRIYIRGAKHLYCIAN